MYTDHQDKANDEKRHKNVHDLDLFPNVFPILQVQFCAHPISTNACIEQSLIFNKLQVTQCTLI